MADPHLGAALLARARNAIASELGGAQVEEPEHPALEQPGATFVTLTRRGKLRGCVGSVEAYRSLDQDVRENARAAAFRDPRFAPLSERELATTRVEVSLLTPAEPIRFATEEDAVRQLRPGMDGVILENGRHRGTFLPQLWERLKHGYAMMTDIADFAGVSLGPGTLYGAISRLEREGLIEAAGEADRRRPYRITARGRNRLEERIAALAPVIRVGARRLKNA